MSLTAFCNKKCWNLPVWVALRETWFCETGHVTSTFSLMPVLPTWSRIERCALNGWWCVPVIDHLESSSKWQFARAKGNGADYVGRSYCVLLSSEWSRLCGPVLLCAFEFCMEQIMWAGVTVCFWVLHAGPGEGRGTEFCNLTLRRLMSYIYIYIYIYIWSTHSWCF